jgi:MinD superfamily P-loop ATPase
LIPLPFYSPCYHSRFQGHEGVTFFLGVTLKLGKQVHLLKSIATTTTGSGRCVSCGACVDRCHFGARMMADSRLGYDKDLCFGCGLCATACPTQAMTLIQML